MARNRKTKTEQTAPTPASEAQTEPAETTELEPNRSVVPKRWQEVYAKSELKGTNDDRIARALAEATKTAGKADPAKIKAIGEMNGIDVEARWGKRNVGMQRMNLGNVLRGRVKRGEQIVLQLQAAE